MFLSLLDPCRSLVWTFMKLCWVFFVKSRKLRCEFFFLWTCFFLYKNTMLSRWFWRYKRVKWWKELVDVNSWTKKSPKIFPTKFWPFGRKFCRIQQCYNGLGKDDMFLHLFCYVFFLFSFFILFYFCFSWRMWMNSFVVLVLGYLAWRSYWF